MEGGNTFVYDRLAPLGEDSFDNAQEIVELPATRSDYPTPAEEIADGEVEVDYISLAVEGISKAEEEEDQADAETLINLAGEELELELEAQACSEKQVWPWIEARAMTGTTFRSPLLQLHQEILDFCKFITPTPEEAEERALAIKRVSHSIKSLWPHCKIEIFGSYSTGLYLPTSDIDVVILDSGCENVSKGLWAISVDLKKRGLGRNVVVITKARVPIIKFVEAESGISFDISFDLRNGPEAAKFIQRAIGSLPPLRPLCMVLKIFLQQRQLNEVYTGGIGSYALLVMLITHLQMHPSRQSFGVLEHNLGVLLLDFFELYGRTLNVKEVGVSCADSGRFFSKSSRGFVDMKRPGLLAVEDPQAPENDIGKNSYQFYKVRAAFVLAHKLLTLSTSNIGNVGILGRIIRGDKILITRRRPTDGEVPTYYFDGKVADRENGKPQEKKPKHKKKSKVKQDDESKRGKRKRDEGNTHTGRKRKQEDRFCQKTKWRKVEDQESPSPKLSRRSTYTDHHDHERRSK